MSSPGAERHRLSRDAARHENWKRWGPYLAERQWGTVREDYSPDGACWDYFPHEHARSRAYRWGEDGLLGICDRQCRLCFAFALWNGRDPFLKERLFGLAGPEGNHGEDCKEEYFYVDATPTASYLRALYKYPQAEFPYERLRAENRRRTARDGEFELADTGVFRDGRYFDVEIEYAKATPDDLRIRITAHNRGPDAAPLHVLPQLWFRNTWSWGRTGEDHTGKPDIRAVNPRRLHAEHERFGVHELVLGGGAPDGIEPWFCDNETNLGRVFGAPGGNPFAKDSFHDWVRGGAPAQRPDHGTKATWPCRFVVPARGSVQFALRLCRHGDPDGPSDAEVFALRRREADEFHDGNAPPGFDDERRRVLRQANAGLLWSRQFYHYDVRAWRDGDPAQPTPPAERRRGRNAEWKHLYNRDVLSMPDKWEYPWYAAWDLAFHMVPYAKLDPDFAKHQLLLLLREWYMAPSGQIPAYEFNFSDVNPPVHAWACWRVYKLTGARGARDRVFLARCFHKLLLNFTWWVNRKDLTGKHLFSGGFLGLDNIGVFDRSQPLPTGGHLEQADGTAWMAFYCATMLNIALELAAGDPSYEDVASKFFEHFVAIADAMNGLGGTGLYDEQDGFYYDQIHIDGRSERLRIRSLVGIIPLFAVEVLDAATIDRLPGFRRRMQWFLEHRPMLARQVQQRGDRWLLAIPPRERLESVLRYLLDEDEFLAPFGVRSLSAVHRAQPFVLRLSGVEHRVDYTPGESTTAMFGGNSNWRGPIWFPVNYLLMEALERYHHFYGDGLTVELPRGSGRRVGLRAVADEIAARLCRLFLPGSDSAPPPFAGGDRRFSDDPHWRGLVWFHEYFHADLGRGCGASHQTGWTALVARCLERVCRHGQDGGRGDG